jgi:hypothetical protein
VGGEIKFSILVDEDEVSSDALNRVDMPMGQSFLGLLVSLWNATKQMVFMSCLSHLS